MSYRAANAAKKLKVGSPTRKAVLLALADCASDETNTCYPSIAYLSDVTELCERAVQNSLNDLVKSNIISVVEKGWGSRSTTYRLNIEIWNDVPPICNDVPKYTDKKLEPRADNLERRAANLEPHSDNLEPRAPQPSSNHHLTIIEPSSPLPPKPKPRLRPKPEPVDLPNWLPSEVWGQWEQHRRELRKPLTPTAAREQIRKLGQWREAGHDPTSVIRTSIANGWQGLFEPKITGVVNKNGRTKSEETSDAVRRALSELDEHYARA